MVATAVLCGNVTTQLQEKAKLVTFSLFAELNAASHSLCIFFAVPPAAYIFEGSMTIAANPSPDLLSELLFESSEDCVKLLDAEGRLKRMNHIGRCLMEIDNFHELQGLHWTELWPAEFRALLNSEIEIARQGGVGHFAGPCPTAKGTLKYWNTTINPIFRADGTLEGFVSVSRDVTALRQTLQALHQSVEQLSQAKLEAERASAFTLAQKDALELAVADAPIAGVLTKLASAAEAFTNGEMVAFVMLVDKEGKHLHVGAAPSLPESYKQALNGMEIGPKSGPCGTVAFRKRPVIVRDIQSDPRWEKFAALAASHGLQACWLQPILCSQDKLLGTFAFYYRHPREPSEAERDFMLILINTAAIVLERDRNQFEQKEMETSLRRSEAKFKRFVDSNIIGMLTFHTCGAVKEANDAFIEMLGYTRADLEQGKLSWRDLTPPKWSEADTHALEQLKTTGVVTPYQKEFFRKDGSRVSVHLGAAKVDDSSDGGIAYVLDISASENSAQALKDSEAKFRTIANAMPQVVWSARPDGFHDYFNDQWCQTTGAAPGSADGEDWRQFFHPDDLERALLQWRHCLKTGTPYEVEFRLRHSSGKYLWTLARALAITDSEGRIVRWMGTFTDIHEQRQAQEKLREADNRKDEFLAMLAHELRNPLAPIVAAAAMIPRAKDVDKVNQMADVIGRQAKHLTGLVEDLLDVSRVSRGQVQITLETLLLNALLSDALEQVQPAAAARQQLITQVSSDQKIYVQGDRKRLVQVLVNILINASKYTPEGGRISLTLGATNASAVVQIEDNGIGMSPQLCASAFELFVQGERAANRSQGGLGLGLALVKSLVAMHGGTVSARSPGPGGGSSFCIELPRVEPTKSTIEPARELNLTAGKGNVLVVDDNEDAAGLLALMLEDASFHVWTRHSPSSALELARQITPDLCLLDIGLPEYDGYTLSRELALLPGLQGCRFAAISGYAQPSDIARSKAAGFDRHFAKPVDPGALIDWVASLELTGSA